MSLSKACWLAITYAVVVLSVGGISAPASAQQQDEIVVEINHVRSIDKADIFSKADFYAKVTIGNETMITSVARQSDNVSPNWTLSKVVPRGTHGIKIQLLDKDPGKPDDLIDVNRVTRKRDLDFTINTVDCRIGGFVDPYKCGSKIVRAGTERKKAEIEFTVTAKQQPSPVQSSRPQPSRAEISYAYDVPSNRRLMPIYNRLKDRDVLRQMENYLSPLRLPRKVTLRTKQCGQGRIRENYKSGADLVLCYEYLARVESLIRDSKITSPILRESMRTGTVAHALLREVTLDIFDQLQLPVWGRVEDAADRLASFLMLRLGPSDKAEEWYGGAGVYFAFSGKAERANFSALVSPDYQRFFNHLCFAHAAGEDKYFALANAWTRLIMKPGEAAELQKFFDLVKLPPEQQGPALKSLNLEQGVFTSFFFKRVVSYCSKEYGEVELAFRRELLPHIDQSALTSVQRSKL